MAALSRFGLTILIAGNASCCGDEDAHSRDNARPLNQREAGGVRRLLGASRGEGGPRKAQDASVFATRPIAAGRLSSAHSEVWLRQHEVTAPHPQEALGTVQANQLHHLLRLVQPG